MWIMMTEAFSRSLGKAAITLYSLVGLTAGPSAKQGIVRSMIMMSTQDSEVLALLGRVTDLVSTAVAGKGCHDRRDDIKKYCCKDGRSLREAMKDLELSKDGNGWHTTLRDDL